MFRRMLQRRTPPDLWTAVRAMELDVYGRHYHKLDGSPVDPADQQTMEFLNGLTVGDLRNMSMSDYATLRQRYAAVHGTLVP